VGRGACGPCRRRADGSRAPGDRWGRWSDGRRDVARTKAVTRPGGSRDGRSGGRPDTRERPAGNSRVRRAGRSETGGRADGAYGLKRLATGSPLGGFGRRVKRQAALEQPRLLYLRCQCDLPRLQLDHGNPTSWVGFDHLGTNIPDTPGCVLLTCQTAGRPGIGFADIVKILRRPASLAFGVQAATRDGNLHGVAAYHPSIMPHAFSGTNWLGALSPASRPMSDRPRSS
jgi:hypothetical protein